MSSLRSKPRIAQVGDAWRIERTGVISTLPTLSC